MTIATDLIARAAAYRAPQSAVLTNPTGLRRFRAALGDALLTGTVHISAFGDSITAGQGTENAGATISAATIADQFGWPGQLRTIFARRFGVAEGGYIAAGVTSGYDGTDSRVATTGAPSIDFTRIPAHRALRIKSTDSITITTPIATCIDILYYAGDSTDGSLIGGFSYQIDGGTVTTGLASGAVTTGGPRVLSITGLSAASHTVKIVGLSASNAQVVSGVRYHSGLGVSVGRVGAMPGHTLLDMTGQGNSSSGNQSVPTDPVVQAKMRASMGGYGAALTIISRPERLRSAGHGQQQRACADGRGLYRRAVARHRGSNRIRWMHAAAVHLSAAAQ